MSTAAIRRLHRTLLVPGLLAAAACGSATDPAATVAGTYALRTVAGKALPATVAFSVDVASAASRATRTLNADGTLTEQPAGPTNVGAIYPRTYAR